MWLIASIKQQYIKDHHTRLVYFQKYAVNYIPSNHISDNKHQTVKEMAYYFLIKDEADMGIYQIKSKTL